MPTSTYISTEAVSDGDGDGDDVPFLYELVLAATDRP